MMYATPCHALQLRDNNCLSMILFFWTLNNKLTITFLWPKDNFFSYFGQYSFPKFWLTTLVELSTVQQVMSRFFLDHGLNKCEWHLVLLYQLKKSTKIIELFAWESSDIKKRCALFLDSTYSMPIERRDTLTTRRSKMLKEFRQKEPLWRMAPYVVIWKRILVIHYDHHNCTVLEYSTVVLLYCRVITLSTISAVNTEVKTISA